MFLADKRDMATNQIKENPNAAVAASAGALVTVAVWVATSLGVDVPPEVAAAVTTLVGAAVLYMGKRSRKPA